MNLYPTINVLVNSGSGKSTLLNFFEIGAEFRQGFLQTSARDEVCTRETTM